MCCVWVSCVVSVLCVCSYLWCMCVAVYCVCVVCMCVLCVLSVYGVGREVFRETDTTSSFSFSFSSRSLSLLLFSSGRTDTRYMHCCRHTLDTVYSIQYTVKRRDREQKQRTETKNRNREQKQRTETEIRDREKHLSTLQHRTN